MCLNNAPEHPAWSQICVRLSLLLRQQYYTRLKSVKRRHFSFTITRYATLLKSNRFSIWIRVSIFQVTALISVVCLGNMFLFRNPFYTIYRAVQRSSGLNFMVKSVDLTRLKAFSAITQDGICKIAWCLMRNWSWRFGIRGRNYGNTKAFPLCAIKRRDSW